MGPGGKGSSQVDPRSGSRARLVRPGPADLPVENASCFRGFPRLGPASGLRHRSCSPIPGMRRALKERIQSDLERRGLAPELSQSLSRRLAPVAGELSRDAYEAMLGGVSLAYGARGGEVRDLERTARDLEEVQQLLCDFSTELRKLDEALEVLSAYALRLRAHAGDGGRVLN